MAKPVLGFVPETGNESLERFLDELVNGRSTLALVQLRETLDGIIAGTARVSDVVLSERGSLVSLLDALHANVGRSDALLVSLDVDYLVASGSGSGSLTSGTVTASASGGLGPYGYAWEKVSGGDVTINSPSAAATSFSANPPAKGSVSAVMKVTATDMASTTGTAFLAVTFIRT